MIDIRCEELLTLAEAAKRLPNRPHLATLYRWIKGLRGVRLEALRVGGTTYTSLEAMQRFAERLTQLDDAGVDGAEPSSSAMRRAAAADAELETFGF